MRTGIALLIVATIIGVCVFMALTPRTAYAHGAGLTLTATSTHLIDVDYNDFFIRAGESGRFDLKLFADEARTKPVEFSKVWVRVVQKGEQTDGTTLFSGWIARPTFGPTGFTIVLPTEGAYDLVVRFVQNDKTISDATLRFEVIEWRATNTSWKKYIPSAVTGLVVIAAASAFIFIRRRRR